MRQGYESERYIPAALGREQAHRGMDQQFAEAIWSAGRAREEFNEVSCSRPRRGRNEECNLYPVPPRSQDQAIRQYAVQDIGFHEEMQWGKGPPGDPL